LEFAAAEWHLDPQTILATWSEEFLEIMFVKCVERKEREAKAMKGESEQDEGDFEKFAQNFGGVKHV